MPQYPSAFSVNVRDLIHKPGEYRDRTLTVALAEDWANAVIGVRAGTSVEANLRLESLHEGILVSSDIEVTATGECVRCLAEVKHPVEVEIQELFAYASDDALEYAIHGDHVDLEPVIRDAVVLALPFQPVCQDDCPGLCPQCGVRLLDEPGHEHEKPADPRWAALAGLTETKLAASTEEQ
ncbi:MAG TPA: DUF177 domain-containing protein [Terrimesophilobacter sp.]|nr:DUF177 domain-containing protein [Terrimesophilobacter sp.]